MPLAPGPYTVFLCALEVWCIAANPAVGPAKVARGYQPVVARGYSFRKMSAPARKLAVADLKSVCTTDEEWEDTYRMVVAAGGKPGGAQALLALAGRAGVPDLPKKAPGLKASVVVMAIKRAAEARADAAASKGKRRAGAKAASGTPRAGKRVRASAKGEKGAKVPKTATKAPKRSKAEPSPPASSSEAEGSGDESGDATAGARARKGSKGAKTPATVAKARKRASAPSVTASSSEMEVSSDDEGGARVGPLYIAETGWLTLEAQEARGLIASAFLEMLKKSPSLQQVSASALSSALEGFYDVASPPAANGDPARVLGRGSSHFMLTAVDIARLFLAGPPVVCIAETMPGSRPRLEQYASMYASLGARAGSNIVMPGAGQFNGAAETLVQRCIEAVFSSFELQVLATKVAGQAQAGPAASTVAATATAGSAVGGVGAGAKFALDYVDWKNAAEAGTGVHVCFSRVAQAVIAGKMAGVLRDEARYLLPSLKFTSVIPFMSPEGDRTEEHVGGSFRVGADGALTSMDAEYEAGLGRAAVAGGLKKLLHLAEAHTETVYILCYNLKAASGEEARYSFAVHMKMLQAIRVFGNSPGLTAEGFRMTFQSAYDKGAMVLSVVGSGQKRPSVSAAYLAIIAELEGSATHARRTAAVSSEQAERLALLEAELARVRAQQAKPGAQGAGAPGAPGAPAKPAGNARGSLEARLPGGVGKSAAACTNALHDPAKNGDPKKWCHYDHTQWGQPEPSPAALEKARAEAKANLAAARTQRRGGRGGRGGGGNKKKK